MHAIDEKYILYCHLYPYKSHDGEINDVSSNIDSECPKYLLDMNDDDLSNCVFDDELYEGNNDDFFISIM